MKEISEFESIIRQEIFRTPKWVKNVRVFRTIPVHFVRSLFRRLWPLDRFVKSELCGILYAKMSDNGNFRSSLEMLL